MKCGWLVYLAKRGGGVYEISYIDKQTNTKTKWECGITLQNRCRSSTVVVYIEGWNLHKNWTRSNERQDILQIGFHGEPKYYIFCQQHFQICVILSTKLCPWDCQIGGNVLHEVLKFEIYVWRTCMEVLRTLNYIQCNQNGAWLTEIYGHHWQGSWELWKCVHIPRYGNLDTVHFKCWCFNFIYKPALYVIANKTLNCNVGMFYVLSMQKLCTMPAFE